MHRYHLHVPGLSFDTSSEGRVATDVGQHGGAPGLLLRICLPVYILRLSRWWSGKVTVARLGSHRGSTPLGAFPRANELELERP